MAKKRPQRQSVEHGNCPTGDMSDMTTFMKVLRWYNSVYDDADANKALLKYVKSTDTDVCKALRMFGDTKITQNSVSSVGIYSRMIQDGIELSKGSLDWFNGKLEALSRKLITEKGQESIRKNPIARSPAQEKMSSILSDLDEIVDNFRTYDGSVYDYLKAQEASGPMIKAIVDTYGPLLEELVLAKSDKDEQCKEAYSHLKARELTSLIKVVRMIVEDAERLTNLKKATRTRKPRARKTVNVAKNITPMKENRELKIVSINPSDVVGTQVAYLYLVKYNQMVEVHAADSNGLTFSGKSLVNFDPNKTLRKGLRKDTDTLAAFSKNGKISARRQFANYRGKEQKLSGNRININEHVAILKAFK